MKANRIRKILSTVAMLLRQRKKAKDQTQIDFINHQIKLLTEECEALIK